MSVEHTKISSLSSEGLVEGLVQNRSVRIQHLRNSQTRDPLEGLRKESRKLANLHNLTTLTLLPVSHSACCVKMDVLSIATRNSIIRVEVLDSSSSEMHELVNVMCIS